MKSQESGLAALSFHEETKHSELSVRTSAHYLDWDNRPYPFKIYENLQLVPLPRDFQHPSGPAVNAIDSQSLSEEKPRVDISRLAELLFFSAGLTRKMNTRAGVYYMRAAPATGALYPIELYLVCREISGLSDGVYHFNPLEFGLAKLREGDYTSWVAEASGRSQVSQISILFTSIAWRNAWKYESRSYRHWFWDSGVIIANLLAVSSAENIPVQIDLGFVDSRISTLLSLGEEREAPVAIAHIGRTDSFPGNAQNEPGKLNLKVKPLSMEETEYPSIWKANSESELHTFGEVRAWRETRLGPDQASRIEGKLFKVGVLKRDDSSASLEATILQRGSTRKFSPKSMHFEHLSAVLGSSSSVIPMDVAGPGGSLIEIFFIANDIEGLPSGSYRFDRELGAVEQLKPGRFRDISGYLCLDQPLFADASAVFFLMTDLKRTMSALGNRGYRVAQFEAGIRAGKIYLASYALGNGASGSTFYDDAVTEFFSPAAKDLSPMIAVGVGVPAYKAKPGKVLVPA